jgi:hypothetical protein
LSVRYLINWWAVSDAKDVDGATIKHLEMVQAVIARMGSNSFAVKTWALGLIAAIFALAAEKGGNPRLLLVALLPILVFWFLDAFYLRQERLFRRLFDAVRKDEASAKTEGPFEMSTRAYEDESANEFWVVFRSSTILWLYLPLALLVLFVFAVVSVRRT